MLTPLWRTECYNRSSLRIEDAGFSESRAPVHQSTWSQASVFLKVIALRTENYTEYLRLIWTFSILMLGSKIYGRNLVSGRECFLVS